MTERWPDGGTCVIDFTIGRVSAKDRSKQNGADLWTNALSNAVANSLSAERYT